MSRSKISFSSKKRKKKIFKNNKGFRGRRKNVFKIAKQAYIKSLFYFYKDTRLKKRNYRKEWIKIINNYLGGSIKYKFFLNRLSYFGINFNRKLLYDMSNINILNCFINEIKEIF
ncbi:50S ribosomal protein L20 [Candidatus Vidania fulgoroideorum]